jgi:hypothetical protein
MSGAQEVLSRLIRQLTDPIIMNNEVGFRLYEDGDLIEFSVLMIKKIKPLILTIGLGYIIKMKVL